MSELEMTPKTRREVLGLIGGVGAALFVAACGGGGETSGATKSTSAKSSATTTTTTPTTTTTTTTTAATATVASCTPDPRGDRRSVPGRRDERAQRPHSERRRPQRHPLELRLGIRRRRRACRSPSTSRSSTPRTGARRSPVQPSTSGTATRTANTRMYGQGVTGRELPPRRAGDRRQRRRDVHQHLPGGLLRTLAAHPLRGVPERGDGDQWREQDRGLAAGAAGRRLQRGLRHRRLQPERASNLAQTSLQTDMVFCDGDSLQTPTFTGDVTNGYTAKLLVGV